jgi:predicted acylesterase/phospholipase RssA
LFQGHELEKTIDKLIRKGFGQIAGLPPKEDPITFGKVFDLMKQNQTFFRPPLLLTATNLSRRRLELISSVDPRHSDMPIAAAVRASAGFPIFFRPREFGKGLIKEWFVDGGVISNFPIWTFSDAFRQEIAKSEFYSAFAWRPWVRIGLRVVDDVEAPDDLSKPGLFFKAIVGMLTGAARNQLEDILAGLNTRSIVIKQPTSSTKGPGVLEVGKVDAAKISEMVQLGYNEAKQELERTAAPGVYMSKPGLERAITDRLQSMVDECVQVMGAGAIPKFRANIFIPVQNTFQLVYKFNMQGDSDENLVFPTLSTGVVGACYQLSTALVCNLAKVAKLRQDQPDVYKALFGMPQELQDKVKKDRTWLMSVPIFDPHEIRVVPKRRAGPIGGDVQRVAISDLGIGLHGPLLGVLNLDAAWDYATISLDPDSDIHSGDPRIRAIADIMQAEALTIGAELTT